MTRWSDATGGGAGPDYAARFDALAAAGEDVHGEAALCAALVPVGSRVLDAGCGTGRVAIRLAELGYDVTGTDVDPSMLAVARERAPDLRWVEADLSSLDLLAGGDPAYDLVVLAGNVVPARRAGHRGGVGGPRGRPPAARWPARRRLRAGPRPPPAGRGPGLPLRVRRVVRRRGSRAGPAAGHLGRSAVRRRRLRGEHPRHFSRLTPRAMTMTDSISADTDSVAISIFARCESGIVSVGLNAEEFVTDT